MNRKFNLSLSMLLATAVLSMGLTMPSCPGQQAMQQQIDQLQSANAELKRQMQSMDSQVKSAANDMATTKQLLEQMTGAIQAQRGALEQLNAAVETLKNRPAPAPAAPAKKAAKSGGKGRRK